MGYVSTWMGNCLSSRPTMGCVCVGISLCNQTFVKSSAQLVSLMALRGDQNTFWPCLLSGLRVFPNYRDLRL